MKSKHHRFKFRAYCKLDIELNHPVRFESHMIDTNSDDSESIFGKYGCFQDIEDPELVYDFWVPFCDEHWIVLQYTGLTDLNGGEICERDIVNLLGTTRYVVWNEKNSKFMLDDVYPYLPFNQVEVIGDIYSNPELYEQITKSNK